MSKDHILLVEDEPDLLQTLSFNFESEGYKVSKALNAGANFSNFCPLPKGFFRVSNCFLKAFILEILTYFIYH